MMGLKARSRFHLQEADVGSGTVEESGKRRVHRLLCRSVYLEAPLKAGLSFSPVPDLSVVSHYAQVVPPNSRAKTPLS